LQDSAVFLVPIGSRRFELYTEAPDEVPPDAAPSTSGNAWPRLMHRLREQWRRAAHTASQPPSSSGRRAGRFSRARDWLVRRIAESIAEQRTLWSLRGISGATFVYPDDLSDASAAAIRGRLLAHARRHHLRWLLVNLAGVALTAVLVILPGPNLIGYYFLFRVAGHYLSWRGARQGLDRIVWRGRAEPALTALGGLAPLSREQRTERVASIAAALQLPRLAVFFDRCAVADRP
jgi:hypothetical protein